MNDALPQWLGDRLGWKELTADVASVYYSLPAHEQRNCAIICSNYGDAGAIELYGASLGLPQVYSVHNSYHTWGPPSDSIRTYIVVHFQRNNFENKFESVEEAKIHTCTDCSTPQQCIPIYIARNPKFSIEREWPNFKIYD